MRKTPRTFRFLRFDTAGGLGGIEPPTRGFSIQTTRHSHTLTYFHVGT